MTFENVISSQTRSASPTSPIQINAPFSAPTDVPAIPLIRTPASRSAFHAPIWYAPLAPPPSSTSPYSFDKSITGFILSLLMHYNTLFCIKLQSIFSTIFRFFSFLSCVKHGFIGFFDLSLPNFTRYNFMYFYKSMPFVYNYKPFSFLRKEKKSLFLQKLFL